MAKKLSASSRWDVHPGVRMVQAWIATLREKTGRSLEQWIAAIKKAKLPDEKAARAWLKSEHGMGTNSAWWLSERVFGSTHGMTEDTPEGYLQVAEHYVTEMFKGPKESLKPAFEKLLELARALGSDVQICPCKTIVPIYRKHVIAQIKPTTRTRIDFGLALKDAPFTGRLTDTGGLAKNDRITHRIAISTLSDIDAEVKKWLNAAYEKDE